MTQIATNHDNAWRLTWEIAVACGEKKKLGETSGDYWQRMRNVVLEWLDKHYPPPGQPGDDPELSTAGQTPQDARVT